MDIGDQSKLSPPNGPGSLKKNALPLRHPRSETVFQNAASFCRATSGPPNASPLTVSAALNAPALLPLTAPIRIRPAVTSWSRRSSTPQVNAPCEPPPCRASAIVGCSFAMVFLRCDVANLVQKRPTQHRAQSCRRKPPTLPYRPCPHPSRPKCPFSSSTPQPCTSLTQPPPPTIPSR